MTAGPSWIWRNPARRDLVSNGKLELSIKSSTWPPVRSLWHDGKKKRVEDCLSDFVAHLYLTAEALKRRRIDLERARIERQEEEYRRFEAQQRQREEERQAEAIEAKLERWRLAQDARAYASEVRRLLLESGRVVEPGSPLEQSLEQLEAYASRTDPLTPLRESCVALVDAPTRSDET